MLRSNDSVQFSVPGKVFLLGEYAVLARLPALVAACGPRFRLRAAQATQWRHPFHASSPAAQLVAQASTEGLSPLEFHWSDPYSGAGGFGASTAQFALAYRAIAKWAGWKKDTLAIWDRYRSLTKGANGALAPSGADLIAQLEGGVISWNPETRSMNALSARLDLSGYLVFSAAKILGRKVATHDHLRDLGFEAEKVRSLLREPLERGIQAFESENPAGFSTAIVDYATSLQSLGFENEAARIDREFATELPGVSGAKGTGALLSDAMIVAMTANHPDRARVRKQIEERGLVLVSDGIVPVPGILREEES